MLLHQRNNVSEQRDGLSCTCRNCCTRLIVWSRSTAKQHESSVESRIYHTRSTAILHSIDLVDNTGTN